MGLCFRIAVVVGQIHCRNRVFRGVGQGGQVAVQHGQFGQREVLHAVELDAVGYLVGCVLLGLFDHLIQIFRRIPLAVILAEPVLGDKFLHAGHLPVDAAGLRDAALGVDVRDHVFRHGLVGRAKARTGLEVCRVAHDEIHRRLAREVPVHIKADRKGVGQLHEHHRERERNHRDDRLAAAAAEVHPRHARQLGAVSRALFGGVLTFCLFRLLGACVRVPHGLDRRHARGHPARLAAGDAHGDEREHRRKDKDQRADRDGFVHAVQLREDERHELRADQIPARKADRDADDREQVRLPPDHAVDLFAGRADGFQKAVKPDIVRDRDLEHVVDDEIPSEDDEQQHGGNGDNRQRIDVFRKLCARIAPVDADVDVILARRVVALVAVVCEDLLKVVADVQRTGKHHVERPSAGLRIGVPSGQGAQLLGRRAGQEDVGRDDRAVILPPAGERECALDRARVRRVAVDLDRHGELRADLGLDAEQGEHAGVGRSLVRALAGQAAFDGFDEIVL